MPNYLLKKDLALDRWNIIDTDSQEKVGAIYRDGAHFVGRNMNAHVRVHALNLGDAVRLAVGGTQVMVEKNGETSFVAIEGLAEYLGL